MNHIHTIEYLKECRSRYTAGLTGDILPFWLEHGLDRENGGVYTCSTARDA